MRSRGGRAYRGNCGVPKSQPDRSCRTAIDVLREEVEHSHDVMIAAICAYKEALGRYRAAVEARFRVKH